MTKKFLAAASLAFSISALVGAPAFAGTLTNPSIGGTAPSDYLTYDANNVNTFVVPNTPANLQKVLGGDATSPTGNVEVFANSEALTPAQFAAYNQETTLQGTIGGLPITLSSLTFADWNTNNFGKTWLSAALAANGYTQNADFVVPIINKSLYTLFVEAGGLQRFSDPNFSYVNQDDQTGDITIGLAGHLDARDVVLSPTIWAIAESFRTADKKGQAVQISEVFKYNYNGQIGYGYSFSATPSGLFELGDQKSHNGNYEIVLKGVPPQSVPEPSIVLGLMGLGGLALTRRKPSQSA
ncbi:hypothetical protein BST81_25590 [Leptolyngbya sp. 'hensonii']|uniref:NF038130 family PEP-CTERM protein n=1 Tax=Leptolyngbya sp. 'hensonii' TaxID=1922337 RepID=UPI00095020BB|nr:NF038130 family PEP-CTERM protein [Leptolyngbya sp. 'hensonii']OLP15584.1 hypothetical protein BST81_25590 [Leptolyngbya sp. 'hensonii']